MKGQENKFDEGVICDVSPLTGHGTSLPDIIDGEDEVTMKGEALMLYFLCTS